MESYLMMLYVTLEQESALKSLFVNKGWAYNKPDLSVLTDKLGPAKANLSTTSDATDHADVTEAPHQKEQPVPKINIATSNAVTEQDNPHRSGKRKAESDGQPATAPKQAKIVLCKSRLQPDEVVKQEKENADNADEDTSSSHRHVMVLMGDGRLIKIKVKMEKPDTDERKKIGDPINDAQDDDNNVDDNENVVRDETVNDDNFAENDNDANDDNVLEDVNVAEDDNDADDDNLAEEDNVVDDTVAENDNVADDDNLAEDDNVVDDNLAEDEGENAGNTSEEKEQVSAGDSSVTEVKLSEDAGTSKHMRRKSRHIKKQYKSESLKDAYNYVTETGSSVYSASRLFGVPESTLRDRFNFKIPIDAKCGPNPCLDEEEEMKLTNHLKELAELGYGYTVIEFIRQASYYAVELGKRAASSLFSRSWYNTYMTRNAEKKRVETVTLPKQKSLCSNKDCITKYYNDLNGIVEEYGLGDTPEHVYIMDEVDMDVPAAEKCDTVTVIGAGNAAGQKIPPYFIMVTGLADEYHYWKRKSHLITQGFKNYLKSHFIKYAKPRDENEYTLVLYDAHRSPLSVELVQWAKSNHILLFPMPPHSSHISKASVEGVFQTIKTKYSEEYGEVSPYKHLTSPAGVVSIVKDMYDAAVTSDALKELFSMCGIYPLQESQVMCDFLQKQGILS